MHRQGVNSIIDCLAGTMKFNLFRKKKSITSKKIEFLTFSVIPSLTSIWAWYIKNIDLLNINALVVGDCSSGLKCSSIINKFQRIPYINYLHGEKIDSFIMYACSSKYVVVCDDDIIWTSQEPLFYALNQFKHNPNLAVVSLVPSHKKSHWLSSKTNTPMGSYCIVIDRQKWINEKLSFQIHKPSDWRRWGHYFDTADYANFELLDRGYEIHIANNHIQKMLIKFTGMSMWGLRIQKSLGEINRFVRPRPDEYEKVYRVSSTYIELNKLARELDIIKPNLMVNESFLKKSLKISESKISNKSIEIINSELNIKIATMKKSVLN